MTRAIGSIPTDSWTPIHYPTPSGTKTRGGGSGDAEVAEVPFTAFTSRPRAEQVTARLIVRRVKRLNPVPVSPDQGELFTGYRHHPVFTDSPMPMLDAEACHRRHAIIE